MSYLNAEALQKSILGKSVMLTDPVKIQSVPDMQAVPGIKMKTTNEQWANSETCNICKQPFKPQRNVNRHHCRICGASVCGQCSRKKINEQRACDFCFLKQYLKKQEHQRRQNFRLRQQKLVKYNEEIKQFQIQIQQLDKEIFALDKSNLQMQMVNMKEIAQKQEQIESRQQILKKEQIQVEKKKQQLLLQKEELQGREEKNKMYFSKVQLVKLDISSKQASLLQKMEEYQRLKVELEKLQTQRKDLLAQFN